MIALRPYQVEAMDAVADAEERGVKKPLVVLPTGTGKTVVFSRLIEKRGGSALILAHRDELIKQAVDKLTQVAPDLETSIGIVKAGRNDTHAPIVVASVQTLAREDRLAQLPKTFDTVVIDEAHHAAADSYQRIIEHLTGSKVILGVTATPERADSKDLADVWDETVYARSILDMIDEGYLSDLIGKRVEVKGLNLSAVKTTAGDYSAADLGRAMEEVGADAHVAGAYVEHAADRKGIVFCPTVAVAHATAAALRKRGITSQAIDASTPEADRAEALGNLRSGKTQTICNVGILTEGFDEPSVQAIVIARPTRSRGLYVQMIGRGTRIHPDKEDCLILDFSGAEVDLKSMTLPGIFDIDPEDYKDGSSIREAADEAAEKAEIEKRKVTRKTSDMDLFRRAEMLWQEHGDRWILALGNNDMLVLDPVGNDGSAWRVLLMGEDRAKVIARNLDLGYAQGIGEEVVRRRKEGALTAAQAAWRKKPASKGQRKFLWALGKRKLSKQEDLTQGEAAQEITLGLATERLERFDAALAAREAAAAQEALAV